MRKLSHSLIALMVLGLASACDTIPDWLGNDENDTPPLAGTRLAVLDYSGQLRVDTTKKDQSLGFEPQIKNLSHPHHAALSQAGIDQVEIVGVNLIDSATVGEGYDWSSHLVVRPVVAEGMVFTMDAVGYVSAHKADDLSQEQWTSDLPVMEDEPELGGGGLAYERGVLYVTTGYGHIYALVARDGSLLWHTQLDSPVRAAPMAGNGLVLALTIDNQLFAYEARTGRLSWVHRGLRESAVYLGTVSPLIQDNIVVVAYTSGELFALRAEDGSPLWSDTLIANKRTSATASLTGINATPVIRNDIVYALSNSGLMVANYLPNGRGVWDMELSGYFSPWVGGDYLFVLNANHDLLAIDRRDKGIRWVRPLKQESDSGRDETPAMTAPIILNGKVMIFHQDGVALAFDPQNGEMLEESDIPDDIAADPVVANGYVYLISRDAVLYRLGKEE